MRGTIPQASAGWEYAQKPQGMGFEMIDGWIYGVLGCLRHTTP
jgi:hypothetical protein